MEEIINIVVVLDPTHPTVLTELRRVVASRGAGLRPEFPGTDDPELSRFWVVSAPETDAPELAASLNAYPGVEGAYIKPSDAMP
jgi:hypothetical protein